MRRRQKTNNTGARLGELFREHSGAVFAYAFHLLGSREEAEDATQVAFLHAYRALERGEELVSPRAWLSTVVKRQAYNRWRDRTPTVPETEVRDRPQDGARDAAGRLAEVRAVLFSLPEAQHQAFVLRHWSGLRPREIAEVLGTTESAVESLLVRARTAVVNAGPVGEVCVDIRERLASGEDLRPPQHEHVRSCRGCRRAYERLTRVAAAAVVLGLVPRAHVAQALASTVPGFATAAGGSAGAASGAGVAAKVAATKVALALVAGTVAATVVAPVAWHHFYTHAASSPAHTAVHRIARPAPSEEVTWPAQPVVLTRADREGPSDATPTGPRRSHPHRGHRTGPSSTKTTPSRATTQPSGNGSGQDTSGDQSDSSTGQSGDSNTQSGGGDGNDNGSSSGATGAQSQGSAGDGNGSQAGSGSNGQ